MECLSLFSGSNIEATRPFIITFVVEKCYHTTKSSFGCHRLIADHRCQQQLPCFSRQPCCAHTSAGSQPTKINNKRGSKTMWRRVSCRTTPDSRAPPCFLTWKHLQLWFNIWPTELCRSSAFFKTVWVETHCSVWSIRARTLPLTCPGLPTNIPRDKSLSGALRLLLPCCHGHGLAGSRLPDRLQRRCFCRRQWLWGGEEHQSIIVKNDSSKSRVSDADQVMQ